MTEKAVVRAAMRMASIWIGRNGFGLRMLRGNRGLAAKLIRACARHAAVLKAKKKGMKP